MGDEDETLETSFFSTHSFSKIGDVARPKLDDSNVPTRAEMLVRWRVGYRWRD
jgi:hypothetical protein